MHVERKCVSVYLCVCSCMWRMMSSIFLPYFSPCSRIQYTYITRCTGSTILCPSPRYGRIAHCICSTFFCPSPRYGRQYSQRYASIFFFAIHTQFIVHIQFKYMHILYIYNLHTLHFVYLVLFFCPSPRYGRQYSQRNAPNPLYIANILLH